MTNTETATARPLYRALGTTNDVTECEHCGRVDLKGTVILGVLDADGTVETTVYYGAVCGAKAAGWTTRDVRRAAAAANRAAAEAERQARLERMRAAADAADAARLTADCPTYDDLCRRETRRNGTHCVAHSA